MVLRIAGLPSSWIAAYDCDEFLCAYYCRCACGFHSAQGAPRYRPQRFCRPDHTVNITDVRHLSFLRARVFFDVWIYAHCYILLKKFFLKRRLTFKTRTFEFLLLILTIYMTVLQRFMQD